MTSPRFISRGKRVQWYCGHSAHAHELVTNGNGKITCLSHLSSAACANSILCLREALIPISAKNTHFRLAGGGGEFNRPFQKDKRVLTLSEKTSQTFLLRAGEKCNCASYRLSLPSYHRQAERLTIHKTMNRPPLPSYNEERHPSWMTSHKLYYPLRRRCPDWSTTDSE